jgi:hypothetical protein
MKPIKIFKPENQLALRKTIPRMSIQSSVTYSFSNLRAERKGFICRRPAIEKIAPKETLHN